MNKLVDNRPTLQNKKQIRCLNRSIIGRFIITNFNRSTSFLVNIDDVRPPRNFVEKSTFNFDFRSGSAWVDDEEDEDDSDDNEEDADADDEEDDEDEDEE